jgi:sterol desaturase/sphingolipid hydroxylase (fatty acid hydroxylase superfamily)
LGLNFIIISTTFTLLILCQLLEEKSRLQSLARNRAEWIYDGVGLFIQGVVIPLAPLLLIPVLNKNFPQLAGSMDVSGLVQFVLSFVVVDYLYYWNHRFFHRKNFWAFHKIHHSSRTLDLLATSRNSLITSFLIVYLWAQLLGIFLLSDSSFFMLGLGFTFALDLYRHSGLKTPHWIRTYLSKILILPEEHVLHHSLKGRSKNYGANLVWWDKLHGTYSFEIVNNEDLETVPKGSITNHIFFPWRKLS